MALLIDSRPLRTVLGWQAGATALAALASGIWAGVHGAVSALLGGGIILAAGVVFGSVARRSGNGTAEETLRTVIRAEAAKVAVTVALLWLVFSFYEQLEAASFFATFVLTVILFSMALLVREK